MESWGAGRRMMECLMDKHIRKTRLVREIVLLVGALLQALDVIIDIVNKTVNCGREYASKL